MKKPSSLVTNISAYKFVTIADIDTLRTKLEDECKRCQLKGTILIATEGLNLFLAGKSDAIDDFLTWLRRDERFADLTAKYSTSETAPFGKLRVRIKREIITMKRPLIRPENHRAPAVTPETLKRWLDFGHDDQGRPVVMMDTRNDFEVDAGSFDDCVDYRLRKFSEFPNTVENRVNDFAGKTVVTYCTGGIRCEKAVLVMREAGYDNVFQLDGGILNYFEKVGGAHWQGACFVFDERQALAPDLTPVK